MDMDTAAVVDLLQRLAWLTVILYAAVPVLVLAVRFVIPWGFELLGALIDWVVHRVQRRHRRRAEEAKARRKQEPLKNFVMPSAPEVSRLQLSDPEPLTSFVMPSAPEVSQLRIGDRDRIDVIGWLSTALAEGRLEPVEYEERVNTAYSAKTASDLLPLTADLPATPAPSKSAFRPLSRSHS